MMMMMMMMKMMVMAVAVQQMFSLFNLPAPMKNEKWTRAGLNRCQRLC